ncbi:hypothetical protein PG994_003869 [Apiospora phragmitis]|uniref:Utp8 beta-propeller domain-containing protein n=1 Tax=Apiospora phragmitis TaxID=2905665 RepID=A0ABR1W0L5_9PEZI
MTSNFQIQKPYVLTTLPRPLDPKTGQYIVGEVYGTTEGSRKRKRPEVTVGIDGEAVNIYDVSSTRLVTSYPIPPQSCFSCAPCSIRRRKPESKEVIRYTYIATRDPSYKVTLYKDVIEASGKTISSTKAQSLQSTEPVVYSTTRPSQESKNDEILDAPSDEVLVLRRNGEVLGLDSETLQQKWKTSPAILQQDFAFESKQDFRLDYCVSAQISEVVEGLFKGDWDAVSSLSNAARDGSNVELLLFVSSIVADGQRVRHLHILGPLSRSQTIVSTAGGLVQLNAVPLPASPTSENKAPIFRLDIRSGTLTVLSNGVLTVYDLTTSIPKVSHRMEIEEANSILRLSKTSVLTSSATLLNIYNPQFQSLQSSIKSELDGQAQSASSGSKQGCSLVAYFSRLELAIGVSDTNLVAIQLEAPKTRSKKRRAEGLLIDSIGRGVQQFKKTNRDSGSKVDTSTFSGFLPGSLRDDYWDSWTQDLQRADKWVEDDNIEALEAFLAEKFGLKLKDAKVTNGANASSKKGEQQPLPEWEWPSSRSDYPQADRRWILYAISRTFQWTGEKVDDTSAPVLVCTLPYTNIINYLLDAGHLTITNVKAALRSLTNNLRDVDTSLAEQLVLRLAELDPTLELLAIYISGTSLGAVELVLAVRTIMRSLGCVQDPKQPPPLLLTNGAAEGAESGENDSNDVEVELDNLEQDILKFESAINGNTGVHGESLSAAFEKLGNCSSPSMVKALRSIFKPEEILSLIHLLRVELVKGAWPSRYMDNTQFEEDPTMEAPPDGVIKLIADLLHRCVDAIGPGGWLLNDAILASDGSSDLITALRLEVGAALEASLEASSIRSYLGQMLKYSEAALKAEEQAKKVDVSRPIALNVRESGDQALPLGLKTKSQQVEWRKVVAGGEIVRRSARETGHLRSQQVGSYSLERIAI